MSRSISSLLLVKVNAGVDIIQIDSTCRVSHRGPWLGNTSFGVRWVSTLRLPLDVLGATDLHRSII